MRHFISFLAIIVFFVQVGCARKQYIEKPTPSGRVPQQSMAPAVQQAYPIPSGHGGHDIFASNDQTVFPQSMGGYGVWDNPNAMDRYGSSTNRRQPIYPGNVIDNFTNSYNMANMPRMVIFFNHELSDNVTSWHVDSVTSVSYGRSSSIRDRSYNGRLSDSDLEDNRNIDVYRQQNIAGSSSRRNALREYEVLDIYEGFQSPMLDSGVNLVSRELIIRKNSAENHSVDRGLANLKRIEMQSIQEFADVLIELLIIPNRESAKGIVIRAHAKDLKTGNILASVSSTNAQEVVRTRDYYVATDGAGFQKKEADFFTLGNATAILLMHNLHNNLNLPTRAK